MLALKIKVAVCEIGLDPFVLRNTKEKKNGGGNWELNGHTAPPVAK